MTVSQLEHGMSHMEFVGWQALYTIEEAEREAAASQKGR